MARSDERSRGRSGKARGSRKPRSGRPQGASREPRQARSTRSAASRAQQDAARQRMRAERGSTSERTHPGSSARARNRADRGREKAAPAMTARSGAARREAPTPEEAQRANTRRRNQATGLRREGRNSEQLGATIAELRKRDREEKRKKEKRLRRRFIIKVVAISVAVVAVIGGAVGLYYSPAFRVTNVTVTGVEHLTSDEMAQLAAVPSDTTLLRVDTETIENRLKASAWVDDVKVNRVFPDTIELEVTEREVAAIVEIPTNSRKSVRKWAIATDHMWLMPIPDEDSDAARTTSAKIYEDAESVMHIKDVPFGTKAEIGEVCSDANINNALDILAGMTTELADRVVEISAAGTAETTLVLDNGVEVAFGKAEDIRDKERVVLEILEQHPDNISYINVRMVETPTWRGI